MASLRQDERSTMALLDRLVSASDRASSSLADLLEFARYVQRSQVAIFRSLGL